jgi:hypothetical protein
MKARKPKVTQAELHQICAAAGAELPSVREYLVAAEALMRVGIQARIAAALEAPGLQRLKPAHRK